MSQPQDQTLEDFARGLMKGAKHNLSREPQLVQVIVLVPQSGPLVITKLSEFPRDFWPLLAAAMVSASGGKRFIATIGEAWHKVLDERAREAARAPSTYEDREEIILIEAKDSRGRTIAHIQPIDRDERGRAVFKRDAYFLGTEEAAYSSRILEFA